MSDNPQIRNVLAYVEARENELDKQAGQLRASIEDLTARLGELDAETENLRITRKTLLNIPAPEPADDPPRPEAPDHPLTSRFSLSSPTPAIRCVLETCARHSTCRSSRRTPKASGPN
ncbi:hypothetical protein [Streptomyces sp. So13.3]|uniref:hypothetical protein n=1 Tax=Streptomyces sp. So13.3 TaxID=2136173 RepID=UPI001FD44DD9|nr:hypothetical protein [Streptomyces sp. So13.3]